MYGGNFFEFVGKYRWDFSLYYVKQRVYSRWNSFSFSNQRPVRLYGSVDYDKWFQVLENFVYGKPDIPGDGVNSDTEN